MSGSTENRYAVEFRGAGTPDRAAIFVRKVGNIYDESKAQTFVVVIDPSTGNEVEIRQEECRAFDVRVSKRLRKEQKVFTSTYDCLYTGHINIDCSTAVLGRVQTAIDFCDCQ